MEISSDIESHTVRGAGRFITSVLAGDPCDLLAKNAAMGNTRGVQSDKSKNLGIKFKVEGLIGLYSWYRKKKSSMEKCVEFDSSKWQIYLLS